MFAIFKKELRAYFINAIGYVYVGVFLVAAAIMCCYTTLGSQSYDTDSYFTLLVFSFVILIPLLTMKLFSEEKKLRTEQLLMYLSGEWCLENSLRRSRCFRQPCWRPA